MNNSDLLDPKKNPLSLYTAKFGREPAGFFKRAVDSGKSDQFFEDLMQAVNSNRPIDWAEYRKELFGISA